LYSLEILYVRVGGPSLRVAWLSTNTTASPSGRKPHGSLEEYSQNKRMYWSIEVLEITEMCLSKGYSLIET